MQMKINRSIPLTVFIVAIMYIIPGFSGIIYHFSDFNNPGESMAMYSWILFLRLLAIACGIFLFMGFNWARWLAIGWIAYHIYIGALNSTSEMVSHIIFLIIVAVLLFLPVSSKFFRARREVDVS